MESGKFYKNIFLKSGASVNEPKTENEADDNVDTSNWKDYRYQILASNIGFLGTIHTGVNLAFSNYLLTKLDNDTSSWFASIVGLSSPVGACICGPIADKFGRKGGNLITSLLCIASWFIMFCFNFDQTIPLFLARFLAGVCGGLTTINLIYVAEISHKKYRPILLSMVGIHFSVGVLLTTLTNYCFTWRQTTFFNTSLFAFVLVLNIYFTPESPIWLATFQSDYNKAKDSLRWLNPNQRVFEEEWEHLNVYVTTKKSISTQKKFKITNPSVWKPFSILLILFLLQQLTGIYIVVLYAKTFFAVISPRIGRKLADEAFIMFGVVRLLAGIVGTALSLRFGRKPLLISSSLGMLCTGLLLTLKTCLDNTADQDSDFLEWIGIVVFLLYISFACYGVMSIPWTLIVELLPIEVRSIGSGIVISYGYGLMFVLGKWFPFLISAAYPWHLFAVFSAVSALLSLFTYKCIPETLGKNFSDIEKYFKHS